MDTKLEPKLLIAHNLTIGRFLFYPGIVVGEIHEGVHVTFNNASVALNLAEQIYGKENPTVYISHRINSYSIDPIGYYKGLNRRFPNLIAFGIVSKNRSRRMLGNFEKLFIKKPIKIFNNLDAAFVWAEDQLNKEMNQRVK